MATTPGPITYTEEEYPSRDGKPVGETPLHRDVLLNSVALLRQHFADDPSIYISGNMLIYYVRGDRRRHISPDVFATRDIGNAYRDRYFLWEEGKGPDFVVEITSRSTRNEDLKRKFSLYQDVLRVREYFLFDPKAEYLKPPLRGYRLTEGQYRPIIEVAGRLPSGVLGLHLERHQAELRFYDPATGRWVPTPPEIEAALRREVANLEQRVQNSDAEMERLRQEVEELRRRLANG